MSTATVVFSERELNTERKMTLSEAASKLGKRGMEAKRGKYSQREMKKTALENLQKAWASRQ